MKKPFLRTCLAIGLACSAASSGWAQLGKPSTEELTRRGNGPGPTPVAAGSNGPPGSDIDQSGARPHADPRDFSGYWRSSFGQGNPGAGAAGRRGGGGPAPSAAGSDARPEGNVASTAGRLPDRILCLPQSATQVGIDGPLLLTQTPEQITWASEEMHTVRRIYLTGARTQGFKPNYYGEALGHWDGDTLVVETTGMKSQPAGAKMVERWSKSADGRSLEMKTGTVDANGDALDAVRTTRLAYRTGEQVLEWMCEDYNDEWLPGGADFHDQVGRK